MSSSNKETRQLPKSGLPARIDRVATITTSTRNSDPRFRSVAGMKPVPVGGPRKSLFHKRKERFIDQRGDVVVKKHATGRSNFITDKDVLFRELSVEGDNGDDFDISCYEFSRQRPMIPSKSWLEEKLLQPVPAYYLLEKTSQYITDLSPNDIFSNISDCCRIMSVQTHINYHSGTAHLTTCEHVELRLSLWLGVPPNYPCCIIVEAQRIKGDLLTYHKYCRHVLDAAVGVFDAKEFSSQEEREKEYYKTAERLLQAQPKKTHPIDKKDPWYALSDNRKPLLALDIAASLLQKDRIDARQLGMDSLCLLTDPARSGTKTALIASQVILTDTTQEDGLCNDEEDFEQDESGFHVREAVLSLVVHYGRDCECIDESDSDDEDSTCEHTEQQEHHKTMRKLSLAVLANSFSLLKSHGEELTTMMRATRASVADAFLSWTEETFGWDILAVLLRVVWSARRNPHDACLSALCLECICDVSKDARCRVKEMNGKNIVTAALEVGHQSHAKLKAETEKLLVTLQKIGDDEEWE